MEILQGRVYENSFFEQMEKRHHWGAMSCPEWDRDEMIDRLLTRRDDQVLRRPYVIQLTLKLGHAKKLEKFLAKPRHSGRQDVEIYTEVEGGISARHAADVYDAALRTMFPGLISPAGIYMCRIKRTRECVWYDPHERAKFFRTEFDRMWSSPARLVGEIVHVNCQSMTLRVGRHWRYTEYHAPFACIVEPSLRKRAENHGLRPGERIEFYPSGENNGGRLEMALVIKTPHS